jgi:WD40 repeat protein
LLPEDESGTRLMVIPTSRCPTDTMIVKQWQAGHQGSAIREVALDDTGCYLASTGDDGHISVWPLQDEQFMDNPLRARINVASFPNHPLNSVDLHRGRGNVLLIAADTPGYRVQLYRKQVANHGCQ